MRAVVVLTAFVSSLFAVACAPDSGSHFDFDKPESHHACVYEMKSDMTCAASDGSHGDWESSCMEDSDCGALTNSTDFYGDCYSAYSYRNKHVVQGSCADAPKATSTPSSSSSNTTPATTTATPATPQPGDGTANCNALVDLFCARFAECDATIVAADCSSMGKTKLGCATSIGVTTSYPTCMTDLASATCTALAAALPTSCNQVVAKGE